MTGDHGASVTGCPKVTGHPTGEKGGTMGRRQVWVWNSPDGEMYFGTAKRAMAYVDDLWPGEITWSQGFDTWIGAHPNDEDPEEEPTAKIYPVEVH